MKPDIQIDRDNGVPLTEQIVTGVTQWIRSRTAHPGSKLPSIRQFSADFGVSRFPVIEAYDRLVSLGYVASRHGSGFYVADRQPADMRCQGTSDPRLADVESDHLLQQFNYPGETLKLSTGFIPESWRDMDGIAQAIRHVTRTDPSSMV